MDYDVYLVGSDQVWNPNNNTSLDPYFLKFAPRDKIRLSYASSFGVSALPKSTQEYYKNAFLEFNAISVREENAIHLVKEVSGKNAQWVLDPTLLLTGKSWIQYAKAVEGVPEKYVLLYEVTPCSYLKDLALYIAQEQGSKVVRINRDSMRQERDEEILNILDAGPAEFLWLFAHAATVVTNSFHGTCFSLNMNKDFYVVTPSRKQNNSRQESLLKLFRLEDRLIIEDSPRPDLKKIGVDYERVNTLLALQREQSLSYLKHAIGGY
jgi:hypothetical protein